LKLYPTFFLAIINFLTPRS